MAQEGAASADPTVTAQYGSQGESCGGERTSETGEEARAAVTCDKSSKPAEAETEWTPTCSRAACLQAHGRQSPPGPQVPPVRPSRRRADGEREASLSMEKPLVTG